MLGSADAAASPELDTLARLTYRAESAARGDGRLDASAREELELELSAAIEDLAPAYHGSPEYCRAGEALNSLHLSVHSDRLMSRAGSIGPLGAIRASGTVGNGSGSNTFEDDDATLS